LIASAAMAATLLQRQADPQGDPEWGRQLRRLARERIGPSGGSARLAAAIMELTPTAPR
jgi:hypothetical protein